MKRNLFGFFLLSIITLSVEGQQPAALLNNWAEKSPVEKVYLHFDRDNYMAGEMIWFKAYLYSDFFPDTISTTLYVELLDANSAIVSEKILPVFFGTTKGQFELPDTLTTGDYYIRAYSPTMLNQGAEFLFQRTIYISGKKNEATTPAYKKPLKVEIFPESGNFVVGMPNTIAFRITDGNGLPLNLSGLIRNENGDSITEFSSYYDGIGIFDIRPSKAEKYYMLLKDDPSVTKYYLPTVTLTGLVFRLLPNPQGRYYEIYQQSSVPSLKADYMIGQMQHRVVFNMKLNGDKNDLNGFINTRQLNSGVLQITIFNKDGIPLAERLSFIDNKEYLQKAELIIDTLDFSARAKNHFTVSFPDTVGGSFSIAVTDPLYSTESRRKENIISNLLLTSDLRGYIHNPAAYFTMSEDSSRNALDMLMMTHGWRRFKWTALSGISSTSPRYQDPGFITISGKVNIRDTKKPVLQKELFLLQVPMEDSLNSSVQFMQTDEQGNFRMDSLVFFGKTKFFVNDVQEKNKKWLDIFPDADSIATSFNLPVIDEKAFSTRTVAATTSISARLAYDYDSILKSKGRMLEGITLTAKKKSPLQQLEERYSSGLFSGLTEKTIDLVNTGEKIYQNNIFDYIQGRVAGVRVERNGFNYQLFFRQRLSLTGGPIPMILYLNEVQTDAQMIATIPANQISMIKVFSSFAGAQSNGAGGVLAIYTKKGSDLSNTLSSSSGIFQYKGYSIIKEFYSPDYADNNEDDTHSSPKDQRITLHWQPDVIVDGVDTKVPVIFYNNERSKSFKVIVEGMTLEGKMVFIEKIITPISKGF